MNISNALYYNSVSPEKISNLVIDIILGFQETNIRKVIYFDIFILIPFYSYSPAQVEFKRLRFDPNTSFQNKIERHPEICANIELRYIKTVEFIKFGLAYALQNQLITINDNLEIELRSKSKIKDKKIFNMARVFSIKTTSYLYNFLKVDIDAI